MRLFTLRPRRPGTLLAVGNSFTLSAGLARMAPAWAAKRSDPSLPRPATASSLCVSFLSPRKARRRKILARGDDLKSNIQVSRCCSSAVSMRWWQTWHVKPAVTPVASPRVSRCSSRPSSSSSLTLCYHSRMDREMLRRHGRAPRSKRQAHHGPAGAHSKA
jgi:hypothetical protein